MTNEIDNPYESPETVGENRETPKEQAQWTFFLPALLLATGLLLGVLASRGRFINIFADFELELPVLTQLVLHPGFVLFIAALLLFTVLKEFVVPNHDSKRRANLAASFAAFVLGAAYAVAVFGPLVGLIEDLS